jgi:hypothetical protein
MRHGCCGGTYTELSCSVVFAMIDYDNREECEHKNHQKGLGNDLICGDCDEYIIGTTVCEHKNTKYVSEHNFLQQCLDCNVALYKQPECEHENDGNILLSCPPQWKCTKCGEFYR